MRHTYKRPDFGFFLRNRGLSVHGRAYTLVGVLTAKWVLARRGPFNSTDVKIRRIPSVVRGVTIPPSVVRSWIGEFLSAWENPTHSGYSMLALEMARRTPGLSDRVKKYWSGW